jgi:SET domain-containing protein
MEIKQSKIQGLGVFATKDIKAGEKLFDYTGVEMSLKVFREKYGEYKYNSLNTYRMKRLNRIIVAKEEPYLSTNLVNFINESLNPNCVLKKRALYALQDIPVGTELTLKYPADYCRNYNLDLQS